MDSDQVTRFFDFPRNEIFDTADLSIPIAYSIVKRFGGYITVESWPGKGTRFDIYFPSIPTSDDQVLDLAPLESKHSTIGIKSSLILIADDDSDIQTTIARYLFKAGYQTASAADGKTALRLYRKLTAEGNQPALLIADLGLPEMDGRTLSTIIQNEFRSAPVLLTSGFKIEINTTTGKTRDGFHFLPKPFEPNALLTTIERLLNPT
jgi:CheY-like chemotaxis protein